MDMAVFVMWRTGSKQDANQCMIPAENSPSPQVYNQLPSFSTISEAHWASQAKIGLLCSGVH